MVRIPKAIAALILAASSSCSSVMPSYWELSPSVSTNDYDRGALDGETYGIMLTAGWDGSDKRHDKTMEAMRRLELATVTGEVQPLPPTHDHGDESSSPMDLIPSQPKTSDEGLAILYWAAGILLLAGAAVLLRKYGLLPTFSRRGRDESE